MTGVLELIDDELPELLFVVDHNNLGHDNGPQQEMTNAGSHPLTLTNIVEESVNGDAPADLSTTRSREYDRAKGRNSRR